MALRVTMAKHVMTVQTGTVGDPTPDKFRTESAFWYALQKELEARQISNLQKTYGEVDLVKKQAHKDPYWLGPGEGVYYLRDRKARYFIYDPDYAIRAVHEAFDKTGHVSLRIHYLVE